MKKVTNGEIGSRTFSDISSLQRTVYKATLSIYYQFDSNVLLEISIMRRAHTIFSGNIRISISIGERQTSSKRLQTNQRNLNKNLYWLWDHAYWTPETLFAKSNQHPASHPMPTRPNIWAGYGMTKLEVAKSSIIQCMCRVLELRITFAPEKIVRLFWGGRLDAH